MSLKSVMGASFAVIALTLAGCNSGSSDTAAPILGSFGIATDNMDASVAPGDNFYEFVNGGWLNETAIPSDRSNYGAFSILRDKSEGRVREIIEAAANNKSPSADEKRIGDFYNAYLDTALIEEKGLGPIQADLDRIRAAKTHEDILELMTDVRLGLDAPVSAYVYIDAKKMTNMPSM